ncbi:PilZ domain-containing protein [Allosphingosinicella deserti]|uniref:PilZ domain-containing protein n=1 Tax=Allosphingosinicella deserti TaxID=2116704 RepID=A0A2P7QLF1_9SPHN|nr:PilZ domain-containing protein [Sphingomonas deserti]PSJ38784.1 hypothetical protein C7I55_15760 [Sphingomonas deserti]
MGSKMMGDRGRRAERMSVDVAARLRPNDWSHVEVTMLDLSELGFRARCDARLQPGGGISLDIPGIGAVEAQVEWRKANQFGARFFVPIDLSRCEWTLTQRSHALAELLVDRAPARRSARQLADAQTRQKAVGALPIHKRGVA